MVHALREIHRLLRPDGALIEIHPVVGAPTVEVREGGLLAFAEDDPGYDYEDDLRSAEDAVDRVIEAGVFVLDRSREFELRTHSSSVAELRDHFAVSGAYDADPKDEQLLALQADLYGRVEQVMRTSDRLAEVVYCESARMTRLRPRRGGRSKELGLVASVTPPPMLGRLYTRAVNICLLAPGASQRAVAIGADVEVPGVVLVRHRSADRTLPAIRHPSAPRAQQALRLSHLTLLSPVPRRRESGSR